VLRAGAVALVLILAGHAGHAQTVAERGAYLFRAGGCFSCHTDVAHDGAALAGGRALATPFGTFYAPNITPDRETGIGAWSAADFRRALREGLSPSGAHYYPAFPYPSYTLMSDEDVAALWAYLTTLPAVRHANRPHDLTLPFRVRAAVGLWKFLFFRAGPFQPESGDSDEVSRGAYLVRALAHCGECHTPRNLLGGPDDDRFLAGTRDGPDGRSVPNITPHADTGIGGWSEGDIVQLLNSGLKPNFDNVQGSMAESVRHGLAYLSDDDLIAIARYLKAIPPIDNRIRRGP